MSHYIYDQVRPIARDMLSGMLREDKGEARLQIRAYYHKDSRQRGLKLSVMRTLESDFGYAYDIMNPHNMLIHLADMPRKPSPKMAQEWADRIAANADEVAKIALASDRPDKLAIATLFADISA